MDSTEPKQDMNEGQHADGPHEQSENQPAAVGSLNPPAAKKDAAKADEKDSVTIETVVLSQAEGEDEEAAEEHDEKPKKSFLDKIKEVFTGGTAEAKDAVDLIKKEHRQVDELFSEFEKTDSNEERMDILHELMKSLTVHTQFEEALVYPRLLGEDKDGTQEAFVEHQVVKFLLAELSHTKDDDDRLSAKVTVLKEMVQHHVKEEEQELLPMLRASGIDLVALRDEIEQLEEELKESYTSPPPVGSPGEQTGHRRLRSSSGTRARKGAATKANERARAQAKRSTTKSTAKQTKAAKPHGKATTKSTGRAAAAKTAKKAAPKAAKQVSRATAKAASKSSSRKTEPAKKGKVARAGAAKPKASTRSGAAKPQKSTAVKKSAANKKPAATKQTAASKRTAATKRTTPARGSKRK